MRTVEAEHALSALREALRNGGRAVGPRRAEVAYHGDCEAPVCLEVRGKRYRQSPVAYPDRPPEPIVPWVTMTARCRECEACRRAKGRLWARRAHGEICASTRTWLVTLTLSPGEHYRALCEARGVDTLEARHRVISRWITLYIKRIRKAARGVPFRYLCVCEAHKSGLPHYHLLVHEREFGRMLPKRLIQAAWPHGFSNAKLVSEAWRGAWYAAKYLGKDLRARVRASVRYGSPTRQRPTASLEKNTLPDKGKETTSPVETAQLFEDIGLYLPDLYTGEADFRARAAVRWTEQEFRKLKDNADG